MAGMVAGYIIGKLTELLYSGDYKPVKEIAKASQTGSATNIISVICLRMLSTAAPIIVIVVAILAA
jgi:K(+)-stimulated pyrophosphate-energized sodium pump